VQFRTKADEFKNAVQWKDYTKKIICLQSIVHQFLANLGNSSAYPMVCDVDVLWLNA